MEYIERNTLAAGEWDDFCTASPNAWARHTEAFIELGLTLGKEGADHSFAVRESGSVRAVVPLVTHYSTNGRTFSLGGAPLPFPALAPELTTAERKQTLRDIFAHIDVRAKELGAAYGSFMVDPLAESSWSLTENPLVEHGFNDTSGKTSVLDLQAGEQTLWAGMSKGYRSDIHFAERCGYTVSFALGAAVTDRFEEFKNVYFVAAGKEVGTPARWECVKKLAAAGRLELAFGTLASGETLGVAALLCYKGRAYYQLSGMMPQARERARGLGQYMQWRIVRHLRERGYTQYELGWQEWTTPKEKSIADFKRRFGGELVPLWRGERRY